MEKLSYLVNGKLDPIGQRLTPIDLLIIRFLWMVQFPDGWMIPRHGFSRHVLKGQLGIELELVSKRGTPRVCHEHHLVWNGLERLGFQGRNVDGFHSRSTALKRLVWLSK